MADSYVKPTLIGNISKILELPCGLDHLILVEAAVQAAMELWWTFTTPVWKTVVEDIAGHSWLCSAKIYANAAEEVKPTWQSKLRKFVFKVDARVDQASWYYFLASVAEEGILDWTSQVLRGNKCNVSHFAHRGRGIQAYGGWPGGDPERWLDNMVWRDPDWPDTPQAVSGIGLEPGQSGWIVGSARLETSNGYYLPCVSRVIIEETGEVLDDDLSHTQTLENLGHTSSWAIYKNNTLHHRTMKWQCKVALPTYGTQIGTALGGYGSSGKYG